MTGDKDIDCTIVFEFIEGDPEFESDKCVIKQIKPEGGMTYIEPEWLQSGELEFIESMCMQHYLKENQRDYGEYK